MTQEKSKNIGVRLSSMLLDHFIMTFIIVILAFIFVGIGYLIIGNPLESKLSRWLLIIPISLIFLIFSIYYNKDAIKGKSPGKRVFKLVVVNNKTGQIANPIRCAIRNLTIILWPIEVIVCLFSPERRIGDYIAGTKVITDTNILETELKKGQIVIALIIGAIVFFLTTLVQLTIQGIRFIEW